PKNSIIETIAQTAPTCNRRRPSRGREGGREFEGAATGPILNFELGTCDPRRLRGAVEAEATSVARFVTLFGFTLPRKGEDEFAQVGRDRRTFVDDCDHAPASHLGTFDSHRYVRP